MCDRCCNGTDGVCCSLKYREREEYTFVTGGLEGWAIPGSDGGEAKRGFGEGIRGKTVGLACRPPYVLTREAVAVSTTRAT